MELTKETMEALARPFSVEAIQWKPGATNKEKTRGLALAYVGLVVATFNGGNIL